MAKFIELTPIGKSILINADLIFSIKAIESNTLVKSEIQPGNIRVRETPEEILKLVESRFETQLDIDVKQLIMLLGKERDHA